MPNTSFKLVGSDSGGALTILEYVMVADLPLHTHVREHESIYVLEGNVAVRVGDEAFVAGAGDLAFLPQGVPHSLTAASASTPRVLAISTPGGFEHFISDLLEVLAGGQDPSSPATRAVQETHGWLPED